jgi:hypothetical protein
MKDNKEKSSADSLIAYFDLMIPLNEEEKELVKSGFQSRLYRKRQYILQEGDVCKVFLPWDYTRIPGTIKRMQNR